MFKPSSSRSMRGAISMALAAVIAVSALSLVGGAGGVWWHMSDKVSAAEQKAKDATQTLKDERELRKVVDQNAENVGKSLEAQKELTRVAQSRLSPALAKSPDCSLSPGAGRVLRDVVPQPANPAPEQRAEDWSKQADSAGGGRAGDQVEVDGRPVSCKAIAEWATRNIGIAQADAVRHQGVIDQYEIVRGASVRP